MKNKKFLHYILAGGIAFGSLLNVSTNVSAANDPGEEIADRADNYLGYNITNFDSTDFVSYVYGKEGLEISSSLYTLSQNGKYIADEDDLLPGDVLFFGTSTSNLIASGIYIGDNEFIVSYEPYDEIKKVDLNSNIAERYYLGAKRFIGETADDNKDSSNDNNNDQISEIRQDIIKAGKKYMGTPYVYGSDRSDKSTMDCSEFVRWAYYEGAGIILPSNSRSQARYIVNHGTYTTDWRELKPGDIMFFMEYKGWRLSNYEGVNPLEHTVRHDGIYLGNGKILHTYSNEAGGVTISSIPGTHWEARFMGGGHP